MTEKEIKWGRIEIRNPNPRADTDQSIHLVKEEGTQEDAKGYDCNLISMTTGLIWSTMEKSRKKKETLQTNAE